MRFLAALFALLALTPALAACGGSGSAAAAGGASAEVVPAGVALYVAGNTDFDGEQWLAAEELVRSFPDGEEALVELLSELESGEGLDLEQDVKPALGPEVGLAVLDFPAEGVDPAVVALTQPEDEDKLQALLAKGDEPAVSEQVDGWTVFSDEQASLDRFKEMRGDGVLADSPAFAEAMEGLAEGSLVSVYLSGEALARAAASDPSFDAELLDTFFPDGAFPNIGAVVRAEADGALLHGQAVFAEDVEGSLFGSGAFQARLPEDVPAGVLAYLSFHDLEQQLSAFRDALAEADPEVERQLGQAEAALGLSLEEDLAPLFAGEGALYVRRGGLIPEVTLVTSVSDEQAAVGTVDRLVAGLGSFLPVGEPTRTQIEGVDARELTVEPPVSLFYAAFDGKLVVTTSSEGIADLVVDGDRLSGQDGFEQAKESAGMPGETTGFLYVDLEETLPLVLGFAGAAGELPPEVRASTEPLQSLLAWGGAEGRTATFSLFVGIE